MDSTIGQDIPEADSDDLAVEVGTLEIDGVRPKVGDTVDVKVSGTISKLVNETAFVTPEKVNDLPIPAKPQATDEEQLLAAAQTADATGAPAY